MPVEKEDTLKSYWSNNTSLHGVFDLYHATHLIEKLTWVVFLVIFFILTCYSITGLLREYWEPPHYSSQVYIRDDKQALFPNITICNYNRAHKDRVAELNLSPAALSFAYMAFLTTYTLETIQTPLFPYQKAEWEQYLKTTRGPKDLKDIISYVGFECSDLVSRCTWNSVDVEGGCCEGAVPVVTNFGKCWTLKPPSMVQMMPGQQSGLSLIMRTHISKQFRDPDNLIYNNYITDGIIVIPSFNPYLNSPVDYVPVMGQTRAIITLENKLTFHKKPQIQVFERECLEDPSLKIIRGTYEPYSCQLDCMVQSMKKRCGCVPIGENKRPEVICNGTDLYICGFKEDEELRSCTSECKDPCAERLEVRLVSSSSTYPSQHFRKSLETFLLSQDMMDNATDLEGYCFADIFYPRTEMTVEEKKEKAALVSFVANVGGQLGLWLGASVLTIIQGVCYIIKFSCCAREGGKEKGASVAPHNKGMKVSMNPYIYY